MGGILGGSGGGSGSTQSTSTQQLDPQIKAEFISNLNRARGVADNLGVQQFAPRTGDYTYGQDVIRGAVNNGYGISAMRGALGLTGANATTNALSEVPAYMSPYLDSVAGNTVNNLARANQIALNGVAGDATAKGAFGGSRSGVAQAETNRNFYDVLGTKLSDIYNTGFNTAFNNANTDLTRQLAGANQLSTLGNNLQQADYQGGQNLINLGLSDQQYNQQQLDAVRNLPLEQQAVINQALGLNPAGGSGNIGTSTSSGNNSSSQGTGIFGLFR